MADVLNIGRSVKNLRTTPKFSPVSAIRMIVSDNRMAISVLKGKGYIVKETEVVGVKIGDQPGKMAAALKVLDLAGINLEYLYAFCARTEKHAYLVIRVADNQKAEEVLTQAGFHMISDGDVAKL